jgi:hypothetical protein
MGGEGDTHVRDLLALLLVATEGEGHVSSGGASSGLHGQVHDVAGVLGVGDRHGLISGRRRSAVDGGDGLADLQLAGRRRPVLYLDDDGTGVGLGNGVVETAERSHLGRLLGVVHLQGVLHLQLARRSGAEHLLGGDHRHVGAQLVRHVVDGSDLAEGDGREEELAGNGVALVGRDLDEAPDRHG